MRRKGVEADLYVGGNDVKTLLLPFDIPLRKYDVVHVQSAPYAAFVFGVPLVVTVHSPILEEFDHYRATLKMASLPGLALEKAALARAGAILAVSEQTKSELLDVYKLRPKRVRVIGNGVEFDRFSCERGHYATSAKRVLVVSRLEPRKNVAEAIRAVAELPPGLCHLSIVGDGSERRTLEWLARRLGVQDRVTFLGRVSAEALPEVYARSGIFLTTSNSEGFGLSLLEAMASGMACIASNIPTHRTLVREGVTGHLFAGNSELVARLLELLSSPQKAIRMGEASRELASGHTWDIVAERTLEAYMGVMDRQPA